MPCRDLTGLVLEADELAVVGGKVVAVLLPPALLGGVLGEGEQQFAAGAGDLVVVEQSLHFARLQPGLGALVSADLGRRPVQCGSDRVATLALALPDLAQLGGEPTAPHRGTTWHGHGSSLLRARADRLCTRPRSSVQLSVQSH